MQSGTQTASDGICPATRIFFHKKSSSFFALFMGMLLVLMLGISCPVFAKTPEEAERMQNTYFSYELFAKHGVYMWIVDPETGIILDANDAMVEAYGYPDLIGMHVREINALSDAEMDKVVQKVHEKAWNRFEFVHVLADGSKINVQSDSYPITLGGKTVLFSIIHDITDKLRAEQDLAHRNLVFFWLGGFALLLESITIGFLLLNFRRRRASEREALRQKALLERMTDNAYDIMTLFDAQGHFIFQSNVVMEVLGYSPEEFEGKSAMEVVHPEDAERIGGMLADILQTPGKRMESEFRMRHRDGEWVWLEASAINLLHDNLVQGILVSTRNITERKGEQEQLLASKETAEQALQTQKRFLANMSHEIRTPMNGFLGMVQLLGMSTLDTEQQELLEMADKSSKALVAVLNDILEMSRLEAGKVKLSHEAYRPVDLLYAVRDMFTLAARQKGIEMKISLKGKIPELCLGDPIRIKQILDNLVGNAIKFTKQGFVEVTLTAMAVPERGRVRLAYSVRDTGIGMKADQQVRIFDPFIQADNSYTKTHAGSGLGLAICRQLAQLMGGEVTVESEWGAGSRFTFTHEADIGG